MTAPREAAAQGTYAPETYNIDKCIPPVSNRKYYKSDPGQEQLRRAHQKWQQVLARKPSHWRFTNCEQPSHSVASIASVHTFSSELDCEISMDNGLSYMPVTASALCTAVVTFNHMLGDTEYYDNEMTQLDVTGLPFGMLVRESPTMASIGVTTFRPVPGGYMVSSFFDVFTEMSPNGGATWIPSREDTGLPLAGHVALVDGDPASTETQPAGRQFLYVPNPLQRGGPIRYSVAHDGPVRLDVFDVSGRLVGSLVDASLPAGERTHLWTGNDLQGRPLSTGIYLFRMTTPDTKETGKAVYTH
jgi:hypothetical protein